MPVSAIVATVMDATANSYATEAEANQYFLDRLHSDDWNNASGDVRKQALLWATKILDTRVDWKGARASSTQALDWPRAYVDNPDYQTIIDPVTAIPYNELVYLPANTIPNFLKWAQCEQALAVIGTDLTLDPSTTGFNTISLPGISLGISRLDRQRVLPQAVRDLLAPYGSFIDQGNPGGRTVRLIRA